jgi:hypothetical protein
VNKTAQTPLLRKLSLNELRDIDRGRYLSRGRHSCDVSKSGIRET